MKNRNVHALAQLLFNVEAFGCLDVFQVDAAQRGLHGGNDVDQLVRIALGQLNVVDIDARKFFEQTGFAFHHGLGGQRANVTQAQHRGAVGDHSDQIATGGVFVGFGRVGFNVQARVSHARRVGERQIALVGQGLGRRDRNFPSGGKTVVITGSFAQSVFGGGEVVVHLIRQSLRQRSC